MDKDKDFSEILTIEDLLKIAKDAEIIINYESNYSVSEKKLFERHNIYIHNPIKSIKVSFDY